MSYFDFFIVVSSIMVIVLFIVLGIFTSGQYNECDKICQSFDYPEYKMQSDVCECMTHMGNGTKYYRPLTELLVKR